MRGLSHLLIALGSVALVLGAISLSEATAGVGGMAAACFLAIGARLAQASADRTDLIRAIRGQPDPVSVPLVAAQGPVQPTPRWIIVLVVVLALGTLVMIGVSNVTR